jgi:hypothetical protein
VHRPSVPDVAAADDSGGPDPYKELRGRGSTDYLLRNTQQQFVDLAAQADFKANMIITVSALLTSLLATRVAHDQLQYAAIPLMAFLFVALVFAILAVIPKVRLRKAPTRSTGQRGNPLFFAHAAHMPREEYLEEMAGPLAEDGATYRAIVTDLHAQATYLVRSKYRLLAVAYAAFLAGSRWPRSSSSSR